MNLIGNVEGKICIMVDDIVDTAGSLCEGAKALKKFGAKDIYACVTHPILTDPALSRIAQSEIKELIVTNTIPLPPNKSIRRLPSFLWLRSWQKPSCGFTTSCPSASCSRSEGGKEGAALCVQHPLFHL